MGGGGAEINSDLSCMYSTVMVRSSRYPRPNALRFYVENTPRWEKIKTRTSNKETAKVLGILNVCLLAIYLMNVDAWCDVTRGRRTHLKELDVHDHRGTSDVTPSSGHSVHHIYHFLLVVVNVNYVLCQPNSFSGSREKIAREIKRAHFHEICLYKSSIMTMSRWG